MIRVEALHSSLQIAQCVAHDFEEMLTFGDDYSGVAYIIAEAVRSDVKELC